MMSVKPASYSPLASVYARSVHHHREGPPRQRVGEIDWNRMSAIPFYNWIDREETGRRFFGLGGGLVASIQPTMWAILTKGRQAKTPRTHTHNPHRSHVNSTYTNASLALCLTRTPKQRRPNHLNMPASHTMQTTSQPLPRLLRNCVFIWHK